VTLLAGSSGTILGVDAVDSLDPDERPLLDRLRTRFGVALGLLFLIGPISDLAGSSLSPARKAGIAVATALFVALYWSLLPPAAWLKRRGEAWVLAALALMPALATVVLVAGAPKSFAALFVYFVVACGMLLPERIAVVVVVGTTLAVGIAAAAWGASGSEVAALALTTVALGVMMTAFGRIARGNRELRAARHELARLAVSEERVRIARDVHDLLGHSLSVIALKSELAGKLVERDPRGAAVELADIQAVSREALAEVRSAVLGYRSLRLDEALEGAKAALAAAGIDYRVDGGEVAVSPEVEAVLAWAVREGATNVVRHSNAEHCDIRIRRNRDSAAVEVDDDGSAAAAAGRAGSGLAGLAERANGVRGRLEAGVKPEGGFRLRLTVPIEAS
jgi:two-component system, NarL family, sensor histidine kinase DesK